MDREIIEGYVITDRLTMGVGKAQFVIGQRNEPVGVSDFVTWECRVGEKDYFWGHYCNDRLTAVADLCRRALEQVEYLQTFEPPKNPGRQQEQKEKRKQHEPER
jgi:hypothetical protein